MPSRELRVPNWEQAKKTPRCGPIECFAVHCARYLLCAFSIEGQGQMSQGIGVALWKTRTLPLGSRSALGFGSSRRAVDCWICGWRGYLEHDAVVVDSAQHRRAKDSSVHDNHAGLRIFAVFAVREFEVKPVKDGFHPLATLHWRQHKY